MITDNTPKPTAVECRFAHYSKSKESQDDIHLVKERVHYADGTSKPNIRLIKNYQRNFYITNKGNRNHKDFKEWEDKSKLIEYKCTQTNLTQSIAAALGQPYFRGQLRDLCKIPYIYGADILSTSMIKQSYKIKYDIQTPYSNAVFDTETDVLHGTGQIIMATLSFKERIITVVKKSFVEGYSNPIGRIQELAKKYIGDILEQRNAVIEILLVDTEIDIVKATMAKAHEWSPDILSVWNITFDMQKIIDACERANVSIEDLLSDPKVPKEYRHFKFKKGIAKKAMASGRILNYKPSQQWHTVICPSSFYWLDAMCAYRQVRQGSPEEPSYGLDALLKKNKLGGKLKFEAADHIETVLEWHKFMQEKYPLEYVVYNVYDCVGMELLDEKTLDIQLSLPMFAGCTDYANFPSLPRKTMNDLHYFIDKFNKVPGSTASEMANEMDEETVSNNGLIVMLPSHLVADNGLKIVLENKELVTNIRAFVADLDVTASYPHNELVMNISKQTTSKELISVKGISDELLKTQTLNFSGGRANSIEFCTKIYGMPTFDTLLEKFKETI